mmetsp:Transcript_33573/g.41232  ORF Transcript_33573/g.41232 Transcript_33573/m.41232 type:complete len:303 (-) Transcript_33573:50-958(-)
MTDDERDAFVHDFLVRMAGKDEEKEDEKKEEEEGLLIDKVLNRLKEGRKKKGDGMTDDERDAFVHDFLVRMDEAAENDIKSRRKGKPALYKLKMLDEVVLNLSKRHLQTIFLERNLLQVLVAWLRPSPVDNALPSLTIRSRIIDILPKFEIEADHLRRGKFGRIIAYLKDCPKESPENRKKLTKLLQAWSRNIFGITDNYRMLEGMQKHAPSPSKRTSSDSSSKTKTDNTLDAITRRNARKNAADSPADKGQYRARIPQPKSFSFTYRPADKIVDTGSKKKKATKRSDFEKKLRNMSRKNRQ